MSSEPALSGEPPCPSTTTVDPNSARLSSEHANTTILNPTTDNANNIDNTTTNISNTNANTNTTHDHDDDDFMFATGDAIRLMVDPATSGHRADNGARMPGTQHRRRAPTATDANSEDEIQSDDGEYDRRGGEHGALLPKLSGALVDSNSSQLQHYLLPGGTSAPSLPDQLVRSAFRQLGRSDNDFSIASQPVAGDVLTTPQAAGGGHPTAGRLQPSAFSDAADSSMAALSSQQQHKQQHQHADVPAPNAAATHSFSVSSMSLSQALAGNVSAVAASQSKTPNGSEPLKIRNVYVAALPVNFTESDLSELLSQFGKLKSCRMFNEAGRVAEIGRAYGFALFEDAAAAEAAVAALDGKPFRSARLQCQLSRNGVVKKPKDRRERARIEAANSVAQLRQSQRQQRDNKGTSDGTPSDCAGRGDGSPTDLARSADAVTPQSPPDEAATPGSVHDGSKQVTPPLLAHAPSSGSESNNKEPRATEAARAAEAIQSAEPATANHQSPAVGLASSPIGIKIPLPVAPPRGASAAGKRPAPSPGASGGAGPTGPRGPATDDVAARLASAMGAAQQASGAAPGVASVRVGFKPPPLPPTEQFSRVNLPGNLWSALAAAQQRDVELHRLQQQQQHQEQQQQQRNASPQPQPTSPSAHHQERMSQAGTRQSSTSEVSVPLSAAAPPIPPSSSTQHTPPTNSTATATSTYSPAQPHPQSHPHYRPAAAMAGVHQQQQQQTLGASPALPHPFTLSPLPSNGGGAGGTGPFGMALPPMAGTNFAPLPPPHQQAVPPSTNNPTPPHSGFAGYHHPAAASIHAAPPSPLPANGNGLSAVPPFGGGMMGPAAHQHHHYSAHQRVVLPPSLAVQPPYHPQYHPHHHQQQHQQHMSPSTLASPMMVMGAPWMAGNPLPFQPPFGFPPS